MKHIKFYLLPICLWIISISLFGQARKVKPVTPGASPEATALLQYIYDISGKYILSGQHNFPISGDRNTRFAADFIGKTPVVWSQDFGFSEDGDKDSYLARPDIMEEAIRQHKKGAIVTLCWHAVPPTADEPVTFQPLPGFDSTALASVQGKLQDQQFQDILTPGTALHTKWLSQVDEIASHLKKLKEANVPVLWRPYHEMNGDWFWWGGRTEGEYTTAALYRQIYDRMAKHHKLNNLIWVWSVDRPSNPGREFEKYYPGNDYLDILSLDVYGNDFNQAYYEGLMELSHSKPLVLGEVGNPPAIEIIDQQPNWAFWVVWSGMVRNTSGTDYQRLVEDQRVLFMEDDAYTEGTKAFRMAIGLEPVWFDKAADFTGDWLLNTYESDIQRTGPGSSPYKLAVIQKDNELQVRSTTVVEWADDEEAEQAFPLDGTEINSVVFNNSPRVQNAGWSENRDTLTINSNTTFRFGSNPVVIKGQDIWTLEKRGNKLKIVQLVDSPRGKSKSIMIFDRQ